MECGLAVESSEQTDSEPWYKLWQEANAIYSHCLRQGESGNSEGLGEQGISSHYSILMRADLTCLR